MLTQPRLDMLRTTTGLVNRAKRAAVEKMFGGLYPAAIHVMMQKTQLDRSGYDKIHLTYNRASTEWSRAQLELLGAFVSSRNGCVF